MRRSLAAVAVAVAAAVLVGPLARPAAGAGDTSVSQEAPEAVHYLPPVDAVLADTFRPPDSPYGAGNRGIDYATAEGEPVGAAAAGEVVFAGRVGSALHAVVLHADGVRTSYSFLGTVAVRRGEAVEAGDTVGTAGAGGLHFGARVGETYVDPLALLGQRQGRVRLVADPDEGRPLAEAQERRRLIEGLAGVGRAVAERGRSTMAWLKERAVQQVDRRIDLALVIAHDVVSLGVPLPVYLAVLALAAHHDQDGCTPAEVAVPPPPPGRRIALLVGGLGSSTGRAAVLDVRTEALGYAEGDVHQFNYRADGRPYGPADTAGDIAAAGRLLAQQVARLGNAHPGTAIDIIAHSMGGLVARHGVTAAAASGVSTVVTLATPHRGADLATAAVALDSTSSGQLVTEGIGLLASEGLEPNATSILQMAETSKFLGKLAEQAWPAGVRVVSVAARWDLVVPSTQSRLRGATNVVVTPGGRPGTNDHSRLPGSDEATREVGLALAGVGATCRSPLEQFRDLSTARQVSMLTDAMGAAVGIGGFWLDARLRAEILRLARRAAPGR